VLIKTVNYYAEIILDKCNKNQLVLNSYIHNSVLVKISARTNIRQMTKLSSKNLLSLIPISLAVLMAGVSPTKATPSNEATKVAPTTSTQPESTSVHNPLAVSLITEPTTEQLDQATEASRIRPSDWAYQTLQALNAKYGCSETLTSGKTLSRQEFATNLSGCVQSIEELVARKPRKKVFKKRRVAPAAPAVEAPSAAPEPVAPPVPVAPVEPPAPVEAAEPPVSQQDLDRLKQLVQSFSTELQSLDARIGSLDKKTAELKAQSFSTTTKLVGEVVIGVNGYGGAEKAAVPAVGTTAAVPARPATGNVLTDRVRLNFDTSFTGKDRLRTRLQSRNNIAFNGAITGTNMTRLGFDGDESNNTSVSWLQYSFPISDQTKIIAETIGSEFNENMNTFNGELSSSGSGSISRFGRFNPVYRLSGDGASLTVNHKFSDELGLAVGYAIPGGNTVANPAPGAGLFNGSNSIISQLSYLPSKDLNLGLIYARSYGAGGIAGGTGSSLANSPFGSIGTTANHYSALASYKVNPGFIVSGWAGFIDAKRETPAGAAAATGTASVSNYALSLAFPDFGNKGNNLAFIVGIPPKLNSRNVSAIGTTAAVTSADRDTSYHIEALYKIKLSDNLAITPGLLLITSPEHNSANQTEYVGTIRTTFKF
jgi:Carbohydrate-selective porin, OprB family